MDSQAEASDSWAGWTLLVGLITISFSFWLYSKQKGFRSGLLYLSAVYQLDWKRKRPPKRLSNYTNLSSANPTLEDLGILPSPIEYLLENPQKNASEKAWDGVHFCGVDSNNYLDISLIKINEDEASVWIIFKDSNNSLYQLPAQPNTRCINVGNEQIFGGSGLRISCLSPLRRWRVSFNGLLRKTKQNDDHSIAGGLVHVKFSFIWISTTLVHDLISEFEISELSSAFMPKRLIQEKDISFFKEMQNRYEQWGQLMGTFKEQDDSEKELYLWSLRTRVLGEPSWNVNLKTIKLYLYFLDGTPLKIEATSVEDFLFNYINGYSLRAGGTKDSISQCDLKLKNFDKGCLPHNFSVSFVKCKKSYSVEIETIGKEIKLSVGPCSDRTTVVSPLKTLMDGEKGFGIMHYSYRYDQEDIETLQLPPVILKDKGYSAGDQLVLCLSDELCQSSLVAGGKGCSLALLYALSQQDDGFVVPNGFVITTAAFENHIKINKNLSDAIEKLIATSCKRIAGDLKTECERCCEEFKKTALSAFLQEEIKEHISLIFNDISNMKFAVRSSAYGEDSEDCSAAGQMLSLLALTEFNEICSAVAECWSSHFRFEAVHYFRQNGQPINCPMAVVIQEMIPSDVAGVMFTVDPVTGNPLLPCITANFGIGETVVSAVAEPDTFILRRLEDNTISILKQNLGSKTVRLTVKDEGGLELKSLVDESKVSSLSEDMVLKIGKVGLQVEKCFCGPRDIEWAVLGNSIFLLQARPITTLHSNTEFELTHEHDTPHRSVLEFWTTANTGEVFPGAISPLGMSLAVFGLDIYGQRNMIVKERPEGCAFCPYYLHWLPVTHRRITLSIIDAIFRVNDKEVNSTQKSFEVGLFGRVIGTEEMHKVGLKKYGRAKKLRKINSILTIIHLSWIVPSIVNKMKKEIDDFNISFKDITSSNDMLQNIKKQMNLYGTLTSVHGFATFLSSFYNVIVLTMLSYKKEVWDSELYGDFATLLSSCTDVESADVPASLQKLAKVIAECDPITFASIPVELAYTLLKNDTGASGKMFNDFLRKHGHRCVKEFDVHAVSWEMQPLKLVQILQRLVKNPKLLNSKSKQGTSVDEAFRKLKTPMNSVTRYILKLVLPRCRYAVGQREKTKSMVIKKVNWMRKSCCHLGHLLVLEGLLPEEELVFFLSLDEVQRLIELQIPGLVSKAIQRRRLHPKLNSLQFPEIIRGIPKPIMEGNLSACTSSFVLEGTPVCHGVIKARARVVLNLEEAESIQVGEILVTHSTDIGWSPYFPLLSGVITVLGGLISHGAVVAREYGLPCVVGVQKATSFLKSGDLIILDGVKGTITKVVENIVRSET